MLYQLFWLFLAFSFLGWCLEVAATAVRLGQYRDRGVLHGPLCLVYGITGCLITIALRELSGGWFFLFLFSALYATVVEWIAGHLLEHYSHTRWWDYSMYRFNLGGFICPQFSLLWGLGSVLLMVVVHPLLSKPSAAIPTLVLIWLDVIFGGLFLADLIVSAIQAVGFSKQLARIDELRKAMRTTSDALTEVIGTSAMTMDTLLDEQKLQLTLAAMEGATNAAELRDQLRELAGKAGTLRDATIRLSKQRFFGTGRLLRAFPDMVPDRREALASLRVGLTKATARAKAAAKQAVKTGKNAMKKEDK